MKHFLALCAFLISLTITGPALANFWQIMPGASIASIVEDTQGTVSDADVTRLDQGLLAITTYIQSGVDVYRCVEYVTEYQFELTRAACFQAIQPALQQEQPASAE